MGRPIKKKNFGQSNSSLILKAYRRVGGGIVTGGAYVVNQRSTKHFVISANDDSWQETLKLVAKDDIDLEEGEFSLDVTDTLGSQRLIEKIYNRTMIVKDEGKLKWGADPLQIFPIYFWSTGPTESTVLTDPGHGLVIGDTITITGADDSDLDGDHVVATVDVDSFTFPKPPALTAPSNGSAGTLILPRAVTVEVPGLPPRPQS